MKNVVHSYSYDLSNCNGTWSPFRSQLFCRRSRVHRTWPLFHIYVFGQISYVRKWLQYGQRESISSCLNLESFDSILIEERMWVPMWVCGDRVELAQSRGLGEINSTKGHCDFSSIHSVQRNYKWLIQFKIIALKIPGP